MTHTTNRRFGRLGAVVASLALVATGAVAGAASAHAGQLDGDAPVGPAVVVVTPVDPQPVVAGHEGDVLLRVSIAMPGTKAPSVTKPAKKAVAKVAKKARR